MNDLDNQTVPTPEETLAYFNSLEPINPALRRQTAPRMFMAGGANGNSPDDLGKVNIDSPAIIAFEDNVSEKNREAVMLGIEFAEAVANSRADIDKDAIKWLKEYQRALFNSGWLTTGGYEYGSYSTKDKNLTMDAVVMELIASVAGPNASAVISLLGKVMDTLGKNDSLMRLFESNSQKGKLARFRIMPCLESKTGVPITYLLALDCEYSSSSGGILFWKWRVSNLTIRRLAAGVAFNSASYERNKYQVLDYLQGSADEFFAGLKK